MRRKSEDRGQRSEVRGQKSEKRAFLLTSDLCPLRSLTLAPPSAKMGANGRPCLCRGPPVGADTSLSPFDPPSDYRFEPELQGPPRRPIPPRLRQGRYASGQRRLVWGLVM